MKSRRLSRASKSGTFSHYGELKKYLDEFRFNPKTVVYTDFYLKSRLTGDEVARIMYEDYGFRDIRLLTAAFIDEYADIPWISRVMDKCDTGDLFF